MTNEKKLPRQKKEYVKPAITFNDPLVDITFATAGTLTGGGDGSPGGFITSPKPVDFDYNDFGTGGLIQGTGGAPGTVL